MAILQVTPFEPASQVGLVGANPSWVYINTNDDEAAITTAGYLNNTAFVFTEYQMALVYTTDKKTSVYGISIDTDGVVTLVSEGTPGTVVGLPVTDGDFVVFDGTDGLLKDAGYAPTDDTKTKVVMASAAVIANHIACFSDTAGTVNDDAATAINGGNIQAGLSGTAGKVTSFPSSGTSTVSIEALSVTGNYTTTIRNFSSLGQSTVYTLSDAGNATQAIMTTNISSPGFSSVFKGFDITAGFADLATGQAVGVVSGGGYKIRVMQLNKVGTNFSGGGGDRNIQISDGTNVFSVIPAATVQSLVNSSWGLSTPLPFPVSVSINTTTAGTLFIAYSGGTTDYTAGSLTLSFVLEKVA